MFVPDGYVPLLEAVSLVAAKIGGAVMAEREPAELPRLLREFASTHAAQKGGAISSEPGHKYPRRAARSLEEVTDDLRTVRAAWGDALRRQSEATVQARAQLLQALGNGHFSAVCVGPDGAYVTALAEWWRTAAGPLAFGNGRISYAPFPWARDLPVFLPRTALDRWGDEATAAPADLGSQDKARLPDGIDRPVGGVPADLAADVALAIKAACALYDPAAGLAPTRDEIVTFTRETPGWEYLPPRRLDRCRPYMHRALKRDKGGGNTNAALKKRPHGVAPR